MKSNLLKTLTLVHPRMKHFVIICSKANDVHWSVNCLFWSILVIKQFLFPLTSIVFFCPYNGSQWESKLFVYQHSSEYHPLHSTEESKYKFEMKCSLFWLAVILNIWTSGSRSSGSLEHFRLCLTKPYMKVDSMYAYGLCNVLNFKSKVVWGKK